MSEINKLKTNKIKYSKNENLSILWRLTSFLQLNTKIVYENKIKSTPEFSFAPIFVCKLVLITLMDYCMATTQQKCLCFWSIKPGMHHLLTVNKNPLVHSSLPASS